MSEENTVSGADAAPDDDAIVVTLIRKEKPFKVETPDGVATYKLVELDGNERDKWLDLQAKKVKYEDGKAAGITSVAGIQASLLSLAIRTNDNARLSEIAIQKWPASALTKLFTVVQKMNGLDKDAAEREKKA